MCGHPASNTSFFLMLPFFFCSGVTTWRTAAPWTVLIFLFRYRYHTPVFCFLFFLFLFFLISPIMYESYDG